VFLDPGTIWQAANNNAKGNQVPDDAHTINARYVMLLMIIQESLFRGLVLINSQTSAISGLVIDIPNLGLPGQGRHPSCLVLGTLF
jgi:hypothetical protein